MTIHFEHVPEQGASDYYKRRAAYDRFLHTPEHWRLRVLADLQVAQFYLPKTRENTPHLTTHDTFRRWLEGLNPTVFAVCTRISGLTRTKRG